MLKSLRAISGGVNNDVKLMAHNSQLIFNKEKRRFRNVSAQQPTNQIFYSNLGGSRSRC
jgi:hypothetical protein